MNSNTEKKKERWDYCNRILNILRKAKGECILPNEYNPYLHSKHEKVIVINSDILRDEIKLKYNSISVFSEEVGIAREYILAALNKRPLTKNALNKILMLVGISHKNIETKGVV